MMKSRLWVAFLILLAAALLPEKARSQEQSQAQSGSKHKEN